jgi:hypothetical protein
VPGEARRPATADKPRYFARVRGRPWLAKVDSSRRYVGTQDSAGAELAWLPRAGR